MIFHVSISATGKAEVKSYLVDAGNEGVAITRAIQKDKRTWLYPHTMMIACSRTKWKRDVIGMRPKDVLALDGPDDPTARLIARGDIIPEKGGGLARKKNKVV